jgi:hypothetical protein
LTSLPAPGVIASDANDRGPVKGLQVTATIHEVNGKREAVNAGRNPIDE